MSRPRTNVDAEDGDVRERAESAAPSVPLDFDPPDGTKPVSILARRRIADTGLAVFPLALGAEALGGAEEPQALLDRFVSGGGNLVDAPGGAAQEVVGRWAQARRSRDRVLLGAAVGPGAGTVGLDSVSIVRTVEAALTRLRTDHLDLLCLDGDDPAVPLEDSLQTVDWLMEKGKVRAVAARGFGSDRLLEARILASTGLPKIVGIQCHYTVAGREEFESELRVVATAQSLAIFPTSSLTNGLIESAADARVDAGERHMVARAAEYLSRRNHRLLATLDRIAAAHDVSAPTIAIAWLLAQRGVVAPIVTPGSLRDLDAAMAAPGVPLTRAQTLELDRASD